MKYQIIGNHIELFEGVVEISAAQAKRRMAALTSLGGDRYQIDNPVQFKVGEVIGIDYDPPKSLIDFMKPIEELPKVQEVLEVAAEPVEEELPMKLNKHKGKR